MGCLAGGSASHKLSIEAQAEVEENGRNCHRFLPYRATEHIERKEQGGEGHKPPETRHGNRRSCLGVVSEAVSEVCVPYLPGGLLPLPPSKTKPLRRQIQAGGRFERPERRPALKERCLLSRGMSCMLRSLACSMMMM